MRSRRKSLLALAALAALASAALYSACFKPDLGVEAFRCNEDGRECPEGYFCHPLTPDDWRCFKEGYEPPVFDSGPPNDSLPPVEGPPLDADPPKFVCSPPKAIATDVEGASLMVTTQGDPVVVYRHTTKGITIKQAKGTTWSVDDVIRMTPANFAATVDDKDRVHLLNGDGTSKGLEYCVRPVNSNSCLLSESIKEAELTNIAEVTSFDLASAGGRVWAAVAVQDLSNEHRGKLFEVQFTPSVPSLSYTKFQCDQKTATGNPVMQEADLAVSSHHLAVSYWVNSDATDSFKVFSYPLDLTFCTKGKENSMVAAKNKPLRMPVALTSGGVIHTAHGNHEFNTGLVHHYAWPFAAPILMLPSKKYEVWSQTSAQPDSVDMALSGDVPVISLLSDHTSGQFRPVLLISDPKSPGTWTEIPLPNLLPNQIASLHTRVAVHHSGRVHLLFDGTEKGKQSLFYIGCEGDLP
jgi:hypothetical protein